MISRNRQAHEAIQKFLLGLIQGKEYHVRDLYQLAVAAGVRCGYATLIGHLQNCLREGTALSSSKGVYSLNLRPADRNLFPEDPAVPHPVEISLYTLHLQLAEISTKVFEIAAILKGNSHAQG